MERIQPNTCSRHWILSQRAYSKSNMQIPFLPKNYTLAFCQELKTSFLSFFVLWWLVFFLCTWHKTQFHDRTKRQCIAVNSQPASRKINEALKFKCIRSAQRSVFTIL